MIGRRDLEPQARRPRLPQGLRRLPCGDRSQGPADSHPGQDHQGLLAGRAFPGPQRHPPDEKACAGKTSSTSATRTRIPISDEQLEENPYLPPYYHPGPEAPEIRYMLERRRALGGFLPERRTHSKASDAARARYLQGAQEGFGQPGGRHHHGDGANIQGTVARQGNREADRPHHSRRGAHVRHGLVVPEPEDLQPQRPAVHRRGRRIDVGVQGK